MLARLVREPRLTEHKGGCTLDIGGGLTLSLTCVEVDIIRVSLLRPSGRALDRSWMVAPGMASLPEEGRPKESTEGFAMPDTTLERTVDGSVRLSTGRLRVTVGTAVGEPLRLTWAWHDEATGDWKLLLRDRPTGAYYVGADGRVSHYVSRRRGDAYFGCGERSGALNRAGRRFDLRCVDAMGYDAERSDPLYKFYPFYSGKPCASSADPSGTGEPPEALGPDGHGEPPPLRAVSRGGGGAYGAPHPRRRARAALTVAR